MDKTIYQQFHGKMTRIAQSERETKPNFVITWKGRDWSGFRTITECQKQFPELETRNDAQADNFAVVER